MDIDEDTSKDAATDAAKDAANDAAKDAAKDVEDKDAAEDESVPSLIGLQRSQEILLMILNYEVQLEGLSLPQDDGIQAW